MSAQNQAWKLAPSLGIRPRDRKDSLLTCTPGLSLPPPLPLLPPFFSRERNRQSPTLLSCSYCTSPCAASHLIRTKLSLLYTLVSPLANNLNTLVFFRAAASRLEEVVSCWSSLPSNDFCKACWNSRAYFWLPLSPCLRVVPAPLSSSNSPTAPKTKSTSAPTTHKKKTSPKVSTPHPQPNPANYTPCPAPLPFFFFPGRTPTGFTLGLLALSIASATIPLASSPVNHARHSSFVRPGCSNCHRKTDSLMSVIAGPLAWGRASRISLP